MTNTSPEPSLEASFDEVARGLEAAHADLERGRIMHSEGVKTGGQFCAFVSRGELVLKLPAERVAELIAAGQGRPFDAGKGRPLKEWVRVRPPGEEACTGYVLEARDFVGR
jgi:hypothetical protein